MRDGVEVIWAVTKDLSFVLLDQERLSDFGNFLARIGTPSSTFLAFGIV
jgi:hypothetical protein